MGNEVASGFSVTRSFATTPDLTFIWDVIEQSSALKVNVAYGFGTDTSNLQTVNIPLGSTAPVDLPTGSNGDISVIGAVSAAWSADNQSYVISLSGQMVRGGFSNLMSSDQNGAPADDLSLIVYSYLN